MANGWHVRFEPTIVFLTPQGGGNFGASTFAPGAKVQPPKNSFPAVTSVRINITDDAAGPSPLKPGDPSQSATLELIGRPAPATNKTPTPLPYISLGIIKGKASYDTKGAKPLPVFTGDSRKVGNGPSVVLDFTPGTDPAVASSDWVMLINPHPTAFQTPAGSFFVQLPWQFVENPGRLQLSARLSIGGKLEADETRNTPLDIPLLHRNVPEDVDPANKQLTFFGVRNLYTKANEQQPNPAVAFVTAGNNSLDIFMHSSLETFCSSVAQTTGSAVLSAVESILSDAGFPVVNTSVGAPADTECALHWKSVGGHFMGRKITDPNPQLAASDPTRLENRLSAAIGSNTANTVTIPDNMAEILPFFEFYLFAENVDPPNPNELAHSESLIPVTGSTGGVFRAQARKAVATPIVVATGSGSPLRNLLKQLPVSDRVNVLASTICHEIGHTFGLRHAVAFTGAPPYVASDSRFARGVMGSRGIVIGLGTPSFPPQLFGPVHVEAIKRLFSL